MAITVVLTFMDDKKADLDPDGENTTWLWDEIRSERAHKMEQIMDDCEMEVEVTFKVTGTEDYTFVKYEVMGGVL